MLATGYFQLILKKCKTYFLPKPDKDNTIPTNRKPITLLESITKTFEKTLNVRFRTHLEGAKQLNDHQFGFRPGKSVQDICNTYLCR